MVCNLKQQNHKTVHYIIINITAIPNIMESVLNHVATPQNYVHDSPDCLLLFLRISVFYF